jgi:hypothetical protein
VLPAGILNVAKNGNVCTGASKSPFTRRLAEASRTITRLVTRRSAANIFLFMGNVQSRVEWLV